MSGDAAAVPLIEIHDLLLGAVALIDRSEYRDLDDGLLAARTMLRLAIDRTVSLQS